MVYPANKNRVGINIYGELSDVDISANRNDRRKQYNEIHTNKLREECKNRGYRVKYDCRAPKNKLIELLLDYDEKNIHFMDSAYYITKIKKKLDSIYDVEVLAHISSILI